RLAALSVALQPGGVIFWHNSILSLMNLTSALSLSLAFRFISLGDFFRWLKSIEKKLKVQWRKRK
ncbi:hypothetical protein, partial [Pseudomonas aeruginosa]|uniref:hypothetical protein n=1 Tax=Pseudomonas aeruginosa TaxID=287 RepID=UPI0031B69B5A